MMGGGLMGGLGVLGGLVSLVLTTGLLVGLVFLGVWLWRRVNVAAVNPAAQYQTSRQPPAREILEIRYARGELTREEFQAMAQDLT